MWNRRSLKVPAQCCAGLFAALLASASSAAAPLTVCVDEQSPARDMDVRLAEAVARQQGRSAEVRWFDGTGDDESGFELSAFADMLQNQCNVVMGFPIDPSIGADALPADVHASAAYGRTGFVLVLPKASADVGLDRLPKGTPVAVTALTTPNLYFVDHPNLRAQVHQSDAEAVAALESGSAKAAMLWRPSVVRDLVAANEVSDFRLRELNDAHAQWELVALYADGSQGQAFDDAISHLRGDGTLAGLLAPYAVDARSTAQASRGDAVVHTAGNGSGRLIKMGGRDAATGTLISTAAAQALFTEAQATAGDEKYQENCSYCHGPTLEGRAGPALKGEHFGNGAFKIGDIFTIVTQNMPATQPASLPPEDYVEIMAYILQQNGYPAGASEMTFDATKASTIPLVFHGASDHSE